MQSPLPTKQLVVLCIVIFAEPVSLLILYPFVYFMVKDFHITSDDRDLGFYVGFIAASFSIAQFLTSIPWGSLSDRIGRRPVILIGLLGNTVTSVLFGMSKSLPWALTMRTLCGLLNGNVAVAKCMVAEITDGSNQSAAFSLFGFSFGLGSLLAPTLGGVLADPATKYPHLFGNIAFLHTYPYLLPCLLSSCVSLFGFVFGYVYLKETLNRRHEFITEPTAEASAQLDESTFLIEKECSSAQNLATIDDDDDDDDLEGKSTHQQPYHSFLLGAVSKSSSCILAYMLLAFSAIIFNEVYVLWCNTKSGAVRAKDDTSQCLIVFRAAWAGVAPKWDYPWP